MNKQPGKEIIPHTGVSLDGSSIYLNKLKRDYRIKFTKEFANKIGVSSTSWFELVRREGLQQWKLRNNEFHDVITLTKEKVAEVEDKEGFRYEVEELNKS